MEKALNSEKECKNCIHYLAHFIKNKTQFMKIMQGHCINRKPSGHYRKTEKACECYEEKILSKEREEQIQSITESLFLISKRINEMTQVLADSIFEIKSTI